MIINLELIFVYCYFLIFFILVGLMIYYLELILFWFVWGIVIFGKLYESCVKIFN